MSNIQSKALSAAKALHHTTDALASKLEEQAFEAGVKAQKMVNECGSLVKAGVSSMEEYIKEKPLIAVGSALLVGLILGKLLSSGKD